MAARGQKFSFKRLINNSFPNFANDDAGDVDLSPVQADNLVKYQLLQPEPRYLVPLSFFIAGITDSESLSKKTYNALLKYGHIIAADKATDDNKYTATVNTHGITKDFANQVAVISVHAQRKLIGLLFFWEEECVRWRMLAEEEREILLALGHDAAVEGRLDLQVALAAVEMKKKLLPSQRAEHTENVGSGRGHELPPYA